MNLFRQLFGGAQVVDLENIIRNGAFLVDVRTRGEFSAGHPKGAVNIPLDQLPAQLTQFRNKTNIIVFCQSGGRSGQAKKLLEKNGIANVFNGGSWTNVAQYC